MLYSGIITVNITDKSPDLNSMPYARTGVVSVCVQRGKNSKTGS